MLAVSVLATGCATLDNSGTSADASSRKPAQSTRLASQPASGEMGPLEAGQLNHQGVARLEAPNDLWERIRRGFAMPDLEGDLVRSREDWYTERPEYLLRMTERSRMYIFHVVEELERRNMPTELALLPFVESAFNPQAVSSAKAAGMWQFMPATGKYFDLTQNVFRDDRRDILASTRAALDYLQKLHNMFGDWHLALAAYNWGEGNVGRAIQRARDAGEPTDYASLRMPNETRMYVPKLQALENIIASPEKFGATLPEIGNHPFFDTVRLTSDIDVATAAELAEIRVDEFKALNPSIHRPIVFAAGTPEILLPWDNAEVFKRNLQARQSRRLASWTAWVAPSNMTVSEAARTNNMSEEEFRSLNNVPPRMLVKAGSTLLVPRGDGAALKVASDVVDQARVAFAPEVVLRRATVRARKGDTLASIANRYDLPTSTVAGWNQLSPRASLKRGQAVVLYLPQRSTVSRALAAESRSIKPTASKRSASNARPAGRAPTKAAAKPTATKTRQAAAPQAKSAKPTKTAKPVASSKTKTAKAK
ncbi:lytic transglycosylase [Comamonas serinivorans]|uniref:Lytic transglycosylase n=1 Tax=Comamonas serinivorans TaxID=1082851 RepID=A0A1Y0ET59_9BURK|nr:transglycosylase SLT domain-containing protein [Comamonas serinivorans]ARU06766.1 lytic transglycosylase [Comamonas serinivorans]